MPCAAPAAACRPSTERTLNRAAAQAITAAALAGLSDLVAQKLAASKAPVNWRRTAAMVAFGGLWSGPSNHFWQL